MASSRDLTLHRFTELWRDFHTHLTANEAFLRALTEVRFESRRRLRVKRTPPSLLEKYARLLPRPQQPPDFIEIEVMAPSGEALKVMLSPIRTIADVKIALTKLLGWGPEEFFEKRQANDGIAYTKAEFMKFYTHGHGGGVKWDRAWPSSKPRYALASWNCRRAVLTANISVSSDEVRVWVTNLAGELLHKSRFAADASILELEVEVKAKLELNISFLSDDGLEVEKQELLSDHERLSMRPRCAADALFPDSLVLFKLFISPTSLPILDIVPVDVEQ